MKLAKASQALKASAVNAAEMAQEAIGGVDTMEASDASKVRIIQGGVPQDVVGIVRPSDLIADAYEESTVALHSQTLDSFQIPDSNSAAVGSATSIDAETSSITSSELTEDKEVVEDVEWSSLPSLKAKSIGATEAETDYDEDFTSLYSFSEQKFSFKLPTGNVWTGAWDRVDIDPETGDVEITEYKTSLKRNRESGLFQLKTYALAYWKVHHVVPAKLVLSSLADTKSIEYKPTKLDLIRTENLILTTLKRMTDGIYAPTNRPSLCINCLYSQQCPSALTASPLFLAPPCQTSSSSSHSESNFASPITKTASSSKKGDNAAKKDHLKQRDATQEHPHLQSQHQHSKRKSHHTSKRNHQSRTNSFHVTRDVSRNQL